MSEKKHYVVELRIQEVTNDDLPEPVKRTTNHIQAAVPQRTRKVREMVHVTFTQDKLHQAVNLTRGVIDNVMGSVDE